MLTTLAVYMQLEDKYKMMKIYPSRNHLILLAQSAPCKYVYSIIKRLGQNQMKKKLEK